MIEQHGMQDGGHGGISSQSGFTIIELLVVMTIIGILAGLAIPIFATYKADAFNMKANSDLRNVIDAEEAQFETNDGYLPCGPSDCAGLVEGFAQSSGVLLKVEVSTTYFSVAACHIGGDREYRWDSESGTNTAVPLGGAACDPTPNPLS